jgi:hypothetical protein
MERLSLETENFDGKANRAARVRRREEFRPPMNADSKRGVLSAFIRVDRRLN